MVKEMYVTYGTTNDSRYVLTMKEDGVPSLVWYFHMSRIEENNPVIVKIDNSTFIEYGQPNIFGIRQLMPFLTEKGELEKRWEKIK